MDSNIERKCIKKSIKMTEQRRIIARVLSSSDGHLDVEDVYKRASAIDSRISISTTYRTLRLFEEADIIEKHDFGDGRARYEEATGKHHDHIIDVKSGRVIEFENDEIERLQEKIATKYGYKLIDHRLELYVVPLE